MQSKRIIRRESMHADPGKAGTPGRGEFKIGRRYQFRRRRPADAPTWLARATAASRNVIATKNRFILFCPPIGIGSRQFLKRKSNSATAACPENCLAGYWLAYPLSIPISFRECCVGIFRTLAVCENTSHLFLMYELNLNRRPDEKHHY